MAYEKFTFAFDYNDLNIDAKYTDTDWHQWSCTYDATTKVRQVYRDGILVGEDKNVTAYQGKGDLQIGHQNYTQYYQGQLDELRIWSSVRSADDIVLNHSQTLSNVPNTLLAYTKFEKYINNTVYNEVTKKNDIGFQGIADKPLSDIKVTNECKNEEYLDFCKKGDFYGEVKGIDLKNKSFTIEFLAKGTKPNTYRGIVSQGNNNNYLLIGFLDNNKFRFGFGTENLTSSNTYTKEDTWHHWACVYDKTTKKQILYRDGVQIKSRIASVPYNLDGTLYIGKLLTINGWNYTGLLDEIRVWTVARTAKEIKDNI